VKKTPVKKYFSVEHENIYGIPFFNPTVDAYAKVIDALLVFGVTSLSNPVNRKGHKNVLVIANLAFLQSAGIPMLGYAVQPSGMLVKTTFPRKVAPNKIKVYGPSYKFPDSDQLEAFYRTGDVSTIENKRFTRYLALTPQEVHDRVYGNGKASVYATDQDS